MTAVLYLNEEWDPANGGSLRLYPLQGVNSGGSGVNVNHTSVNSGGSGVNSGGSGVNSRCSAPLGGGVIPGGGGVQELAPSLGALALFWSHRVEHEVLPAYAARYALSLWVSVAPDQPPGWLNHRR